MLEFVQGDIFDVPADIRVNTVNCVGVMGAGVALAFKQRYPEMFREYVRDCKSGQVRPGLMHIWKSLSGDWVINFPTKRDWREPSRYEDIDAGLDDLRSYLDGVGPVTVALPALGCGNGGLNWNRVSQMIREKLEGVNAHVFVFEPAASRRANKSPTLATEDELKRSEQLGYQLLEHGCAAGLDLSGPVYISGQQDVLSRKWIALLPSRAPGEREMQALRSIASELAKSKAGVTVALVHGTKFSEEIAELLSQHQVDTVLLLPFGVLTRKALAKKVASGKSGALTIASAAPASTKWSRRLFAQTIDILRINAAAVLLSDPEPYWLTSKSLDRWGHIMISYLRYETMAPSMREALGHAGAKPIGRRSDTGAPNVEHLLNSLRHAWQSARNVTDSAVTDSLESFNDTAIEKTSQNLPQEGDDMLTIKLDEYSSEARQALFDAMATMNLKELLVKLGNESDRRLLLDLASTMRAKTRRRH